MLAKGVSEETYGIWRYPRFNYKFEKLLSDPSATYFYCNKHLDGYLQIFYYPDCPQLLYFQFCSYDYQKVVTFDIQGIRNMEPAEIAAQIKQDFRTGYFAYQLALKDRWHEFGHSIQ